MKLPVVVDVTAGACEGVAQEVEVEQAPSGSRDPVLLQAGDDGDDPRPASPDFGVS
jgi:hypothetical protein